MKLCVIFLCSLCIFELVGQKQSIKASAVIKRLEQEIPPLIEKGDVPVSNDYSSHVIAENGNCNTSMEAEHSVNTKSKVIGSLAMNRITKNKTAEGKNGYKNLALY